MAEVHRQPFLGQHGFAAVPAGRAFESVGGDSVDRAGRAVVVVPLAGGGGDGTPGQVERSAAGHVEVVEGSRVVATAETDLAPRVGGVAYFG